MSNKYGLILPDKVNKNKPVFQASRNVFGDESDSEEEGVKKPVLLQPSSNINRQAKIAQDQAVSEDPTVFQYDEVYDSIISKKSEEANKIKEVKKPKYIENLLKTANKRKIENERRIERQVQKEREKEGEEFADKEVFVTTAYKKKLEEMRQEEEKEKREEYLESIGDVTKQRDLGGFYRHLYEQKLGDSKEIGENDEKDKRKSNTPGNNEEAKPKEKGDEVTKKKDRNYRKRKSTDSSKQLSEGEIEGTDNDDAEINRVNLDDIRAAKKAKPDENIDADSDFSIDSSDEEEESKVNKEDTVEIKESEDNKEESNTVESNEKIEEIKSSPEKKEVEAKLKIDIWKKRTVGEVFEEALRRYYERKASRGH